MAYFHYIGYRASKMIVNNEVGGILKEVEVEYFKIPSNHFLGPRKVPANPIQSSWSSSRSSIPRPP